MDKKLNPVSLLLQLAADRRIVHALITCQPEQDFRRFIDEGYNALGAFPSVIDTWLVRLDFQQRDRIPNISSPDLMQSLVHRLELKDATVNRVMPLFDVHYCRQRGRDELATENNHVALTREFLYSTDFNHLSGWNKQDNPLLQGICTDRGLQLFSVTPRGCEAFRDFSIYCGEQFFSKERGTDRLDYMLVYPLIPNPVTADRFSLDKYRSIPLLDLPAEMFCDDAGLLLLPERKFDLLPTVSNFRTLHKALSLGNSTKFSNHENFMRLALLHQGACTHINDLPKDLLSVFSYQQHFHSFMKDLDCASSPSEQAQVSNRIRELAGKILDEDFPQWRYCPEPDVIQARLQAQSAKQPEPLQDNDTGLSPRHRMK